MQKITPLLILLLIILYGVYNAKLRDRKSTQPVSGKSYSKHIQMHHGTHTEEELARIQSDDYLKQYIIDVINHGSAQLKFKKDEVMEAGFAPKEDAEKIACYVMTLSGRKCKKAYSPDAASFFTSICGGCHGDDGKGINGTYPDLTQKELLGIKKRREWLRNKVAQ